MAILDEFARSEGDFAEVIFEPGEYSSTTSAYGSIRASIERFGYTFKVRTIRGKVYLDKN
jgi:virulence-associated protein VapD